MPYFPFIDGMRALAVLSVIIFHFGLGVPGGYIGVDIFFVISGFLITSILLNRLEQPAGEFFAHFYERRARRILPALVVMAILSFAIAYLLLLPKDMQAFAKSMRNMAVFFSNFSFSREVGYFDGPAATKPLLHTWSLAVEEQFYLFFPPALLVLWRALRKRINRCALLLFLAWAASLAANLVMIRQHPEGAFFLPQARAWELLTGSMVAVWGVRHLPGPRVSLVLSVIALAIILGCLFTYTHATLFPGAAAIPPVLASGILIWVNVKQPSFIARLLAWKPLLYVGLISYGLYLYHWPVIVFSRFYYGGLPPLPVQFATLAFVFVLASLSLHFIEEPIRHGRWLRRRRHVFIASLLAILALFIAGQVVGKHGLPERFDDQVRQYASAGDKAINKKACPRTHAVEGIDATVCVVGDGDADKPEFLVWGDSHSSSLIPGMHAKAKQTNRTGWVYANTGCLPLVAVERVDEQLDTPCLKASRNAVAMIENYRIHSVLMAGRWDMYTRGWEPLSEEVTREPVIEYEGKQGMAALRAALPATLQQLKALDASPWIFLQVPPQLNDVPTALATAEYFGRDRSALRREASVIRDWHAPVVAVLRASNSTRVIDPMPFFCPDHDGYCRIELNGYSLYSDNDHLSIYGSQQLAPLFAPFFAAMR